MGKKIRVWDGTAWQDVSPSLPYTAIHSAQASMPLTGVDGQVWLDTDGTLAGQDFVQLSGGTMTGNLNTPSINSGPIVGRNKIINGDFSIWQRGTSFLGSTESFIGYTADRWYSNSSDVTRENFSVGNAIPGHEPQYFLKAKNRTGQTAGRFDRIEYRVEDVRTFAGQTVTFSFWTKKPANKTGIMGITTIQDFGSGGGSKIFNPFVGVTYSGTGWERKSFTMTLSSIANKTIGSGSFLSFEFYGNMGGTPDYEFDIWGFQLEAGNQATPFHTATPNQQTELAACQRYYFRVNGGTTTGANFQYQSAAVSTTIADANIQFPVTLRTVPSSIEYSNIGIYKMSNGTIYSSGSWTIQSSGQSSTNIVARYTHGSGFQTAGADSGIIVTAGTGASYFAFSAEL